MASSVVTRAKGLASDVPLSVPSMDARGKPEAIEPDGAPPEPKDVPVAGTTPVPDGNEPNEFIENAPAADG